MEKRLPLVTYQAGENVLTAGSRTGRLLILKKGAVVVVKETIEIVKVVEPGAVFGELSTLLDQPHSADVRALETSQFHVADADALLVQDPLVLLYVAAVLARRLDAATQAPQERIGLVLTRISFLLKTSERTRIGDATLTQRGTTPYA